MSVSASDDDRRSRQLSAFASTAAVIAREPSLARVLDLLAAEVRSTTGMATCAVVLMEGPDDPIRYVGRSGLPQDYITRFEAARQNGAFNVTSEAWKIGRAVVSPGTRDRVLADQRWAPAHQLVQGVDWDTFVAIPLIVRSSTIGVLNGFYPRGRSPDDDDVQFLSVMADHAAIAVDNAQLLASRQLWAAEVERNRLASELHDSVSQALFSLALQARGLELRSMQMGDADLARQLVEMGKVAQHTLKEMRALIQFRRPTELRKGGLVDGLHHLAETIQQHNGLAVRMCLPEEAKALSSGLEDDLFRLVQEALNNVVKHAEATTATVRLSPTGSSDLVVEIMDDGVGIRGDSPGSGGFGMATMRQRTERHGGMIEIGSNADNTGTRVRVVFPGAVAGRTAAGEP